MQLLPSGEAAMPEITDNPDLPDESDVDEPTEYATEPSNDGSQDPELPS